MAERPDPASWLAEHGDYLFRYALLRVGDEEVAKDLVQETLLAAWQGQAAFRGDAACRTWLTGILKHKIIDHIRRQVRKREVIDEEGPDVEAMMFSESGHWLHPPQAWDDDPERFARNRQLQSALLDCLRKLPPRQRSAFALRELEGLDSPTLCKAMGVTTTNLNVLLHRARLALRRCLEEHGFAGEKR